MRVHRRGYSAGHSHERRVDRRRADKPKFAFNVGPAFRWHVALTAYPGMIGGIGLLPRRIWGSARTSGTPYQARSSIPMGSVSGVQAGQVPTCKDVLKLMQAGPCN